MSKMQAFLRARSRASLAAMLLAGGIGLYLIGTKVGDTLAGFAAAV
ncbi:hypothetical protein [Sphingomonas sp. IW22]